MESLGGIFNSFCLRPLNGEQVDRVGIIRSRRMAGLKPEGQRFLPPDCLILLVGDRFFVLFVGNARQRLVYVLFEGHKFSCYGPFDIFIELFLREIFVEPRLQEIFVEPCLRESGRIAGAPLSERRNRERGRGSGGSGKLKQCATVHPQLPKTVPLHRGQGLRSRQNASSRPHCKWIIATGYKILLARASCLRVWALMGQI